MTAVEVSISAIQGIPAIREGDDLASAILGPMRKDFGGFRQGDVLVVAQKIISKSEGRIVSLREIEPSPRAIELSTLAEKDPRLIELILRESRKVLRVRPGTIIVEDERGLVLANAGIDASNVSSAQETVLLLPLDPDKSAEHLREHIKMQCKIAPAVIIADSIGRAWRLGTIGTAIGVAGLDPLLDLRGMPDMYGRFLQTTEVAIADELAGAASLVMGQADERIPAALVRGFLPAGEGKAANLLRPTSQDLFR